MGPLSLIACIDCAHIFNGAFDAQRLTYAPGYENSQHASSVFRDYAERLVDRLVDTYAIRDTSVIDIGCGRGDLLALICERGDNRGYGFDPSYSGPFAADATRRFTVQRTYFASEHAASIRPSLVCCRHVLEHVEDPIDFLRTLHTTMDACGDAVLYLEVPSGEELLESNGLWDYLYEHISYFSAQSLLTVLNAAGFEVLAMRRDFGGQFLCAEARAVPRRAESLHPSAQAEAAIHSAAQGMRQRLDQWRQWAAEVRGRRKVVLWGGGSKGVMFLNLLGCAAPEMIDCVVDQNTDKHGRFVSGTGQEIVSPQALRDSGVDEIVLMNGIYEAEVRSQLQDLGVAAQLTIAWPQALQ